jgi:hypothetical protein
MQWFLKLSIMEANELRIGNLILKNNEIYEISSLFFVDLYDGKIRENYNNNYVIEPIKITKEWLLKFKAVECKTDELVFFLDDFIITLPNYFCYKGTILKKIKYVHQLQNLYFALTQRELTVA